MRGIKPGSQCGLFCLIVIKKLHSRSQFPISQTKTLAAREVQCKIFSEKYSHTLIHRLTLTHRGTHNHTLTPNPLIQPRNSKLNDTRTHHRHPHISDKSISLMIEGKVKYCEMSQCKCCLIHKTTRNVSNHVTKPFNVHA